ncbi:Uncharacterised protein [Clostridioides difficile]|nr:Uncharacterised protein [Clostridioides difficile]VIF35856.1 Uncharacterised protein [Clostridioides difficile]VIF45364.1 Uncharacterised protein [Clostridioides difficile]
MSISVNPALDNLAFLVIKSIAELIFSVTGIPEDKALYKLSPICVAAIPVFLDNSNILLFKFSVSTLVSPNIVEVLVIAVSNSAPALDAETNPAPIPVTIPAPAILAALLTFLNCSCNLSCACDVEFVWF